MVIHPSRIRGPADRRLDPPELVFTEISGGRIIVQEKLALTLIDKVTIHRTCPA